MYEIYTDGACKKDGSGGVGVVITQNINNEIYVVEKFKAHYDNTTNQRMEIEAVIDALNTIFIKTEYWSDTIKIYSDSAYVCNAFNQHWIDNWLSNGWINSKKEPVANRDLWEKLLQCIDSLRPFSIHFIKIKGHNGNVYNEMADKLAVAASMESLEDFEANTEKPIVVIINGVARSGKDTFVEYCQRLCGKTKHGYWKIYNKSTIDPIKELAIKIGWNGEKTESARKFLSDLKHITSEFCNYSTNWLLSEVEDITNNGGEVVFIHSREPKDIDNLFTTFTNKGYKVFTLLIRRDLAEANIPDNPADKGVFDYDYNDIIFNNDDLNKLEDMAEMYLNKIGIEVRV